MGRSQQRARCNPTRLHNESETFLTTQEDQREGQWKPRIFLKDTLRRLASIARRTDPAVEYSIGERMGAKQPSRLSLTSTLAPLLFPVSMSGPNRGVTPAIEPRCRARSVLLCSVQFFAAFDGLADVLENANK
jgi:hypothetical protein